MSDNFISDGKFFDVVLASDVVSGEMRMIGALLGVAQDSGLTGETVTFSMAGDWTLPCSGVAFDVGQPLNYDLVGDTLYFSASPVSGDWVGVAMSFSPGGGAIIECAALMNRHHSTFVV